MESGVPPPTDDRQAQITDYLQAPRKKRKNYVILALPDGFNQDITNAIVSYVRKNFPQLAISHPETTRELTRQFGRNISLLVIDHDFEQGEGVFELIKTLKEKRNTERIPVLFMTKHPSKLVATYHKMLLPYQETDDYVSYSKDSTQKILSRIKNGVELSGKTKTRRFSINHTVSFFHLDTNQTFEGKIVDLSIHGAELIAKNSILFREGEQLKISIPTLRILNSSMGEFLKLSARVRRVFIGGNHAGISFEYVSEVQNARLTEFVVNFATKRMSESTQKLKAKAIAASKVRE